MKFAQLDADSRVLRVVVADSLEWLQERLGGTWVEASDTTTQQQGAGPGLYDSADVAPRRFIPAWVQPFGAGDPNLPMKGDWRWHEGRAWRCLADANAWEPGIAAWREMLVAYPEWVQPVSSVDAYQAGERITFNGKRYTSKIDANVWSPATYAAGWTEVPMPDASLMARLWVGTKNMTRSAVAAVGLSRAP